MTFIKQTLKNTASLLLAVGIIGSAYAAISTVSSGDPLTADSWNQIVNKFDGIGENSVKEYVDATVSANSSNLTWAGYTTSTFNMSSSNLKAKMQACSNDFPGSHWASTDEIVRLGSNYPWSQNVWPRNGVSHYALSNTSNNQYAYIYGQGGYLSTPAETYGTLVSLSTSGESQKYYTSSLKLPCVY